MTASLKAKPVLNSTPEIFRACCEARAHLYSIGEYELEDAIDGLQEHAERHGLIEQIGQDAVQQIMVEAFRGVPDLVMGPVPRGVAQSTLDAADYLHTLRPGGGPEPELTETQIEARWRRWLAGRPDSELAAIQEHLRRKEQP
jgi:hypothetical protein